LKEEGNELLTICKQLKMKAADGKMRLTDVADMQGIFRIIQSIPSPKAEPFKLWLAEVGKERIDEIIDPELTIDRALEAYLKKGYKREWINQRLQAIQVRKELTDAWDDAGNARKEIEKETGKPVITSKNAMDLSRLIEDVVKEPINKTEANKEKNK